MHRLSVCTGRGWSGSKTAQPAVCLSSGLRQQRFPQPPQVQPKQRQQHLELLQLRQEQPEWAQGQLARQEAWQHPKQQQEVGLLLGRPAGPEDLLQGGIGPLVLLRVQPAFPQLLRLGLLLQAGL
jgi:hypothetical protein